MDALEIYSVYRFSCCLTDQIGYGPVITVALPSSLSERIASYDSVTSIIEWPNSERKTVVRFSTRVLTCEVKPPGLRSRSK